LDFKGVSKGRRCPAGLELEQRLFFRPKKCSSVPIPFEEGEGYFAKCLILNELVDIRAGRV